MRLKPIRFALRKTALAATFATVLIIPCTGAQASGLQTQMDRIFTGMTHTTPPGVWNTQRRGVISGGRITAKSRIMTENLVRVTPPSWAAGCGGVDMHMGSFSFINSDQMVQLLRSIAANAQGYAFQLALDTVFPMGAKWMENFQKVVRAMNGSMLNSCEAGQGVVNDTINALQFSEHVQGMTEATNTGLVDGFFDSFSERTGQSTGQALDNTGSSRRTELRGNVVWKEMRRNAVHSWFPGGDLAFLEAILSVSGSTIIGEYDDNGEQAISMLAGNLLTLEDLMEAGDIQVYDCSSDPEECNISGGDTKTISNFVGMAELFRRMLLGHDGSGGMPASPGILPKMAANSVPLTEQEQAFMASLPQSIGSMLRNLVVANPGAATFFVNRSFNSVALIMAYELASGMIHSSIQTVSNSNNPWAPQVNQNLMNARANLDTQLNSLSMLYPDLSNIIGDYHNTLESVSLNRYMLQDMSASRAN